MMKLYEKLERIQQELKAPKGQYNNFGNYSYRSCEDIFEAVKLLLLKYGVVLQTTDELVQIGERYYIKATAILTDIDGNQQITNTAYAREEETKKGMDGSQITGASSSYARKYALNGLFLIDDQKDSDTTNKGDEITIDTAKGFVFASGKHEGQTIEQVAEKDEKYLQWWMDNKSDSNIAKMISLITGLEKTPIPSEEEQKEKFELMDDLMGLAEITNTNYEEILKHYKVESNADMTIEQLKEATEHLKGKLK